MRGLLQKLSLQELSPSYCIANFPILLIKGLATWKVKGTIDSRLMRNITILGISFE